MNAEASGTSIQQKSIAFRFNAEIATVRTSTSADLDRSIPHKGETAGFTIVGGVRRRKTSTSHPLSYTEFWCFRAIQGQIRMVQLYPRDSDYSRREKHKLSKGEYYTFVGTGHSAGGHSITDGIRFASRRMILEQWRNAVRVRAGTRWIDLLKVGIVPLSMQSYYDFTVAGSISVNAHGPFYECPPVGQIVTSMILSGQPVDPSMPQFWRAVGGYGTQGRIEEVTLRTQPDTMLAEYRVLVPSDFLNAASRECLTWSGHMSPDWSEIYIAHGFAADGEVPPYKEPSFFWPSVVFSLPKKARWALEKGVGPFISAPLSQRMAETHWFEPKWFRKWRYSWLLEFFIPRAAAPYWIEEARQFLPESLMNTTIRDVAADPKPVLSYSPERSYGFVMYGRTGIDETQLAEETRRLIDITLEFGGKFYPCYRPHYTIDQFRKCYPRWEELLEDMPSRFSSRFVERYLRAT